MKTASSGKSNSAIPFRTGTVDDSYKLAAMELDPETGSYHTLFRQYASNLGRWLSTDPVLGQPCTPQSFDRYAYVMNSPTNLTDPTGLCSYTWLNDPTQLMSSPCNNSWYRSTHAAECTQFPCAPSGPLPPPPPRGGGSGGGLTPHVYVWTGRVFSRTFGRYGIICHYSQDCPNGTTPSCSPSAFSLDVSIGFGCPKYMVEEGLYTVGGGGEKHCLAGIKYGTDKPKDCK